MSHRIASLPRVDGADSSRLLERVPGALSPSWTTMPEAGSEGVAAAVRAADGPKGYLHWDDFRHRPSPPGWTAEEVWTLTRMRRDWQSRPLSELRRKDHRPFCLVESAPYRAALQRMGHPTKLWAVFRDLLRVGGDTESGGNPSVDLGRADETFRLMAAIEEAHSSSAIEGAVTTRRQSKELLRSGRAPRGRSERMVFNVFRTTQWIQERLEEPLSPDLLREIHSILTDGTLDDEADRGRFREDDSVVVQDAVTREVIHQPPPVEELAERMERLCAFANALREDEEYLHPITKAILLHHQLAYDHPFVDGNGRTARSLFQWYVLRSGFPWFRLISISRAIRRTKQRYYRSFQHVQTDDGDVTYFVRDQFRGIEAELARLATFLEKRARTAEWLRSRHEIEAGLNARQISLLEYALGHAGAEFSVPEHRRFHGVSQPTAYKDMRALIEAGLLCELRREGRRVIYGPTDRLAALVRERPKGLRRS